MSKQTIVLAVCNLCPEGTPGKDARELNYVSYSLEGQGYGLDLCDDHYLELKGFLQPYTAKADLVGGKRSSAGAPGQGSGSTAQQLGLDPKAVREWARNNGFDVPEVGRLNQDILNAYMASTGSSAPQQAEAPAPASL